MVGKKLVDDGTIEWVDDECIGFKCKCGESLVLGIYDFRECDCKRKYIMEQRIKIYEK